MSLVTKIKLKDNCGKLRTEVKVIRGVVQIALDSRTQNVDPSARVTIEVEGCDRNVVNKLKLPCHVVGGSRVNDLYGRRGNMTCVGFT